VVSGGNMAGGRTGIIASKTYFPMASGGVVAGEAGAEIIAPLSRSRLGGLLQGMGSGSGSETTINVMDQRSGGEKIQVTERTAGSERIVEVLVRDEVRKMYSGGAIDSQQAAFGARRRPIVR
jgi:phage-related minor tail protein